MKNCGLMYASLGALAFALAACGGGGSPRPTPPPPTGTPSPTPSPTPTPTPTPTPPPAPPTGANEDLIGDLESESFANVVSRYDAEFRISEITGTATANVSAQIIFDAQTNSYSLVTPTGSITFTPDNIDADLTTDRVVVYVIESGGETSVFTLTKAATSGTLTYQYVGAAFWERAVEQTGFVDATFDAFVYGAVTPQDAVPATGKANYTIDLLGSIAAQGSLRPMRGLGTLTIDFSSDSVILVGLMDIVSEGETYDPDIVFNGSGQLAPSGTFSGNVVFAEFGLLEGELAGRLFGPGAQEVGATFAARSADGQIAAGSIIGRRGADDQTLAEFDPALFGTLSDLPSSQSFAAQTATLSFTFDGTPGAQAETGAFTEISAPAIGPGALRYDALTGTYTYIANGETSIYDPFNGFLLTDNGETKSLGFFDVGRPQGVAISYTQAGTFAFTRQNVFQYEAVVFGAETALSDIPTTGQASYRLGVGGVAADTLFRNPLVFDGIGALTVDFGNASMTGNASIQWREYAYQSGLFAEEGEGVWTFDGTIASGVNGFEGTVTINGFGDYSGQGTGRFFGPGAEELGGVFETSDAEGNAAIGTFIGALDPSASQSSVSKDYLSSALVGSSAIESRLPSGGFTTGIDGILYNRVDGNYSISLSSGGQLHEDPTAIARESNILGGPEQRFESKSIYSIDDFDALTGSLWEVIGRIAPDAAGMKETESLARNFDDGAAMSTDVQGEVSRRAVNDLLEPPIER